MTFSYPKNKGVTLPSVEGPWGAMGIGTILRDPPKGQFTRRKDRVGDTQIISEMINDSGDRFGEGIQIYARGVNPFVSVSYSNYGNNGGVVGGGGKQAFLPHRIMRDGVFRPPILRQEDLLPLSRLPRLWTFVSTNPEIIDYSIGKQTNFKWAKEIHPEIAKISVEPTVRFNVETVKENFQFKVRDNVPMIPVNASKTIIKEMPQIATHLDQYINDRNIGYVITNPHIDISTNTYYDQHGTDIRTKNPPQISQSTAISSQVGNNMDYTQYDKILLNDKLKIYDVNANTKINVHKYIEPENELYFDKNIPSHNFTTNISDIQNVQVGAQSYERLPNKINIGGYEEKPTIPRFDRDNQPMSHSIADPKRLELQNKISKQFEERAIINQY